MLDLEASVDLEEVEAVVNVEQELGRARSNVAGGAHELQRRLTQASAQRLIDGRRRRLFDHLLVASLERALALAEVNRVAVRVGQDLDLDVPRAGQIALQDQSIVAECRSGLAPSSGQRLADLVGC